MQEHLGKSIISSVVTDKFFNDIFSLAVALCFHVCRTTAGALALLLITTVVALAKNQHFHFEDSATSKVLPDPRSDVKFIHHHHFLEFYFSL